MSGLWDLRTGTAAACSVFCPLEVQKPNSYGGHSLEGLVAVAGSE